MTSDWLEPEFISNFDVICAGSQTGM